MESEISSISISSKKNESRHLKSHEATTTTNDSKMLQLDSIPSITSQKFNKTTHATILSGINRNASEIEIAQKQLISKF